MISNVISIKLHLLYDGDEYNTTENCHHATFHKAHNFSIDQVLGWAQEAVGQEYLVNGKLEGKDVKISRAPQRYGFTSLSALLGEE